MRILGIDLYNGGINSAIDLMLSHSINENQNLCISATGAHGIIEAKKNRRFKEILDSFYLNLPDGMPSVWLGRIKGANQMNRCYGPNFFKEMMINTANRQDIHHFFCGGNDGVADKLKIAVNTKYHNNHVTGTFCPPFLGVEQYDYPKIAEYINESDANIVWIGLSSPKQEQFAYYLAKHTQVSYICCVGAAFDFHIDAVPQAPLLMQNLGLEWFYRLLMEPKRLWKRYLEIVPLFIYYNFVELLTGKFFPKKSL